MARKLLSQDFMLTNWLGLFFVQRASPTLCKWLRVRLRLSCPPSRTITNWSKTVVRHIQVLFWLFWEEHKLTGDTRVNSSITFIRKARRNANDCAYNWREQIRIWSARIWSPVFNPEKSHLSYCLRTKFHQKKFLFHLEGSLVEFL